jgi:hypothetical protein
MRFNYTTDRMDAARVANDIWHFCDRPLRTVLVLVSDDTFEKLENRDSVDVVDPKNPPTIDELKEKKVVFCTFSDSMGDDVREVKKGWETFINGDIVDLKVRH